MESWSPAQLANSLPANDIAAFVSDGRCSFVGTFDQGVAELQSDGSVRPIDVEGNPHVNALAIAVPLMAFLLGPTKQA